MATTRWVLLLHPIGAEAEAWLQLVVGCVMCRNAKFLYLESCLETCPQGTTPGECAVGQSEYSLASVFL